MADYVARVEIFDANAENYESLHEKMREIGFSKTIIGESGKVSALPDGTYVGSRSEGEYDVREMIKRIADPLSSRSAAIFVCSFDRWSGWLYSAT
ncbi:type V toxin-antitoxin system endoribonuclease antitoxin GhoS [Yersinia pekkanenii]|uniref:Phage protein n=1 Tax=Yersinia pekkanenii TaxID=1288385 RepID=A0A0T9RJ02_9GAMM|nr:type V toxin-antitoxin system endoribonuclease antitoxin GhoS [Yersinia pekkanenii]CNI63406.1 phage protein [Yersinia pekkanenii]CRY69825.1 phage protein [Yersinia pekkanenii]